MNKKLYSFFIGFLCIATCFAQPLTPAPDPTATPANVISVYADVYTNVAGTDFFPYWGQSTVVADFPISANNTKRLTNFNYQGIQLASPINASTMENLHIDLWSTDCTTFELFLINTSPGTVEQKVNLTPITTGWNSFDIPLSSFNLINLSNIGQFKFVSVPFGSTTVYYDNLYFWKSANAPTLSNFSIPAQVTGAAPFTITPPTSNSSGTFTYTSSNTNVATISGSTITIVGASTSTITATQAPAGTYGQGVITTVLTVTTAPPTTPANNPTIPAADAVSIFSDSYTNLTGTDFFPNWGQSTVVTDYAIGTNNTKRMTTMNYQGIQFGSPIDVSATANNPMQYLHIDLWTPNGTNVAATSLKLFLISPGPAEFPVTLNITTTGWNSFDIPLSTYGSNGVNLANLIQIKFESVPFGGPNAPTIYYDNLYFWKAANAPTLSNFNIPPQVTGAAPFTITPPTSNSSGTFTYTSSNTNVATISGSTITIVGAGTSTITATQAPAGGYGLGIITTILTVTAAPPTVPAANPLPSSPDVLSIFSDSYTNLAGTDFFPNWGQSTVVADFPITANNTKRMTTTNYQGIQFASPIDVSASSTTPMQYLHIDLWTPNGTNVAATALKLFLISPGPAEFPVTLNITTTGWNSFDIPLSTYGSNGVNLANLIQIKFESVPFGGPNAPTIYYDNLFFSKIIGLPITLTNFKAISNKNVVQIKWTTQNETNNKGFSVEKSTNGTSFLPIAFVNGKGNSSIISNYAAVDNMPSLGNNYYRLKQIDFDGRFSYSPIEMVRITKQNSIGFSFFPNPVSKTLNVNVSVFENSNAQLNITNSLGQIVSSKRLQKSTTNQIVSIDVSTLQNGVYYINLNDGEKISTEKITINH